MNNVKEWPIAGLFQIMQLFANCMQDKNKYEMYGSSIINIVTYGSTYIWNSIVSLVIVSQKVVKVDPTHEEVVLEHYFYHIPFLVGRYISIF